MKLIEFNLAVLSYCQKMGVTDLRKENEKWGGFGEYSRQEFIQWLIKKSHIPV